MANSSLGISNSSALSACLPNITIAGRVAGALAILRSEDAVEKLQSLAIVRRKLPGLDQIEKALWDCVHLSSFFNAASLRALGTGGSAHDRPHPLKICVVVSMICIFFAAPGSLNGKAGVSCGRRPMTLESSID